MKPILKVFIVVVCGLSLVAFLKADRQEEVTKSHDATQNPIPDTIVEVRKDPTVDWSNLEKIVAETARMSASCSALGDFYWAMGDTTGTRISGSTGAGSVTKDTSLEIASASKIVYAAYVAEKNRQGLPDETIERLRFTSGYTQGVLCFPFDTPTSCFFRGENNVSDPMHVGKFYYGPGHMLALAALDPDLQKVRGEKIGTVISAELGFSISYENPKLAGAGVTTPEQYALFLQKLVGGEYYLSSLLGTHAVCASAAECSESVSQTPIPKSETWQYSLGHWVESDPNVGDGSFSSPGAFGFYPWVDATKTYWGILAREDKNVLETIAIESVMCGRELRKIFLQAIK